MIVALHTAPCFPQGGHCAPVEVHELEDEFVLYSCVVTLYVAILDLSYAGTHPSVL